MKYFIIHTFIAISFIVSTRAFCLDLSLAEKTMDQYLEALRTYDTSDMAALMHPEALQRFRGAINSALNGSKHELARAELLPLFSTTNLSEYESLSDRDAFKRLNDTVSNSAPQLIEMLKQSIVEVISVSEKNGVAYVVYVLTMHVNEQKVSKEIVQKLKVSEGKWLLLLSAEAAATIASFNVKYN